MEAQNIADLIRKAQVALDDKDEASAKQYTLQAIIGTNNEKERFLTDVNATVSEQQLADWYGSCSFILNMIGEDLTAARCFYTATVFDPQWTFKTHAAVADVLWGSLVFLRDLHDLRQNVKKIFDFLAQLDNVAKLAERRRKWLVSVAIDNDINRVYIVLIKIGLGPERLITQPGRKNAIWRSARCALKLNLHQEVRKLCIAILQNLCDYDDTEALEIWARSLFETGEYDLAYAKSNLALNYCQDGGDRQRLEEFQSEILEKLAAASDIQHEPDEDWLEGTNVNNSHARGCERQATPEKKKKKRHKRPKAVDRSALSTPLPGAQSREVAKVSRSSSSTPPRDTLAGNVKASSAIKTVTSAVQRLRLEEGIDSRRKRNESSCSTATTASGASGFGTETSLDYSVSDSDSDVDISFEYATSSRTDSPDVSYVSEQDIATDAMQEEMSFFEQSCRFYQENDDISENLGSADVDEKLLKTGITLNMSYMHQFEDTSPEVMRRDQFYTEFLDKSKLQQKLLENPKKYIRCVIQIEAAHEAYCKPFDAKHAIDIIEISGRSKIGQAYNEDEVVVELLDDEQGKHKRYGKVIGVWNRQRHKNTKHPVFICTLDDMDSLLVRPMCKTIPKIHILDREIRQKYQSQKARRYKIEMYDYDERSGTLCNPRIKDINPADQGSFIFLVAYIIWGTRHVYPRGAIIKRLPSGSSVATGLMVLNLQHEVPTLYKKRTVDQVSSMITRAGDEPSDNFLKDRIDLTGLNIFTIDPPDSKDLDDALSVEKIEDGYRVGVHIADVAMYIPQNTPIDEEARHRATTFYPGIRKSRNMIPEPLSANLCSLLQGKLRLTISVFFYIGRNGMLMQMEGSNFEIVKSFIRSKRQLTYGEAQEMLSKTPTGNDDMVTQDIKCLFEIARMIRKKRLGNAMFALDLDWEESQIDDEKGTMEAHYLVEEFMIMTNRKVAERLLRIYRYCVPLRCQPPPTKENLEEFFKENNNYMDIVVRLQEKQLGPKIVSFFDCLNEQTSKTVMLSQSVWDAMSASPKSAAARYLRKDDLHPLQLIVYQHWLFIQQRAGYRCSGSLTGVEDGKHYSLDIFPYTHFTSPIRRYNDLIIHRLVHAGIFEKKSSPYEKEEIDTICLHINSVTKRAKAYEKGCKSLQQAVDFKSNPKMINCSVDEVTDRGITLCSPLLKYVSKSNRELTFNHLDMGFKPDVFKDNDTNWNKVKAVWRKRLYDFQVKPNYPPDRGNQLKLNPHKGVVFLPLYEWARMLKFAMEGNSADLSRTIKNANVSHHGEGLDDVSTECYELLQMQPTTQFSMTYARGQQVKIQMSAAPFKGIIAPKPMLYNMTGNVKFCLQHTENPVLYLYRYVTRGTCDQYQNLKLYLERWLPIMLMESATGIVRNEESCNINNVHIKFSHNRKGKFALGLTDCVVRNIEFSGTEDDDEGDADDIGGASSYDWLCLKTTLPVSNTAVEHKKQDVQSLDTVWLGHAEITRVKKKKDPLTDGKITVSFSLHEKAPEIPTNFHQTSADQRFSVEILRKSEVDRRSESFIKKLLSGPDTLAAKIALNKRIPDLDKDHKHIAGIIERDLYYEASNDDPRRRPLPRNNKMQQEAIDKALMSRFSLIHGPPGTGKTYTGIKLVSLFNKVNHRRHKEGKQRKQVLFCGPSNRSVDLVAEWMYKRMGNHCPDFVRVYGRSIEAIDFPIPGRTFLSKRSTRNQKTSSVLHPVALHYLIRQKGKKHAEEINAFDKSFKANNYEPNPDEVGKYVHLVREASIDEIRKHDVILCTTAVGSNPKVLEATSVHQVIVDEAGMCPEPQCLVPIIATKAEQVVLIGDHKQLRPIIMCKEAGLLGLGTSLFERYAMTKCSQNVKVTMLEEQYRMNPQICRFPSKQFYGNALVTRPGPWCNGTIDIWPNTNGSFFPHVFVHVAGEEKVLTVSTEDGNEKSKSNTAEIDHVLKVYSYFTKEKSSDSVQILSQYNSQCSEIKRRLNDEGFVDENVSTVVSSQGGEWDYVIFSTVRSLPDYKIEENPTLGWCKHNLGFITDQNQVNVALTRARKGLIIIGNTKLLSCDFVWKKLIQHYDERGCIMTTEQFPPRSVRTRQQRMKQNIADSNRRYGESMFKKGEATSYTGSFDDWEESGGKRRRRNFRNE